MLQSNAEVHDIDISATAKNAMLIHLLGETISNANITVVIEKDTLIIGISFSLIARKIASAIKGINERQIEIAEYNKFAFSFENPSGTVKNVVNHWLMDAADISTRQATII